MAWLTVLALACVLLVVVNGLIFLFACYEYGTSSRKDAWLTSTQILPGEDGNAKPSVILLHGFGGSPYDLRPLAERLAQRGYRAVVPALQGQCSTSFAYGRGRFTPAVYRDFLLKLLREETALAGAPPMLVGFSMGGALAAIAAAEYPVGRLVLVSPYFQLAIGGRWAAKPSQWLRWMLPVVPKLAKGQISDPEGYKAYETGTYLVSLSAFLQLTELAEIAQRKAAGLALPTLVVAPRKDTVASFEATRRLFEGREQVRMMAYDRGNHILAFDLDRESVMADIVSFLTEGSSQRGLRDQTLRG
jgi:carboxylesterase